MGDLVVSRSMESDFLHVLSCSRFFLSVCILLYRSLVYYNCIFLCSSFLFSCQYLPSNWLERLLESRRLSQQRQVEEGFYVFYGLEYRFIVCLSPALNNIFHTPVAQYSLFVLKHQLTDQNTNQPTDRPTTNQPTRCSED